MPEEKKHFFMGALPLYIIIITINISTSIIKEQLSSFLLQSSKSKKPANACQEERGEIEIYVSKLPWQVETEKFIILTFEYLLLALSLAHFSPLSPKLSQRLSPFPS